MSRPRPDLATLGVVGTLHLVANIGYTFFVLTLSTILLGHGAPLSTAALLQVFGAVYGLRFLAAAVVDRVRCSGRGHYRGWLIRTQLLLVAAIVAVAPLDPVRQLPLVLAVTGLVLVVSAVHDSALAGLTVVRTAPLDRGLVNGVQVASASLSMLVGSSGALLLYARAGWTVTVLVLATVFVLPLAVLARMAEPQNRAPARVPSPVLGYFRHRRNRWWALVMLPLFGSGIWLAYAPQHAILLAAGWSLDGIAVATATATAAQTLAAVLVGAVVVRYGLAATCLGLATAAVPAVLAALPAALGRAGPPLAVLALVGITVVYGGVVTCVAAVSMQWARAETAATDYTIPLSVEMLCVGLVQSAGLALAGLHLAVPVLAAAGLAVVGLAVAPRWIRENLPASPRAVGDPVPAARVGP
ncbi:MFS transporter [Nocardia farcinica]|uniref:MFS transporter n=1 Tax=Nocardia farcinica TaxID=37329 RepID=UPI0024567556|nr:MFS transporter [Nocardia farcinica]